MNKPTDELYLLEPKLPQARAIARRLRSVRPLELATVEAGRWESTSDRMIPTGSRSTQALVDRRGSFSFRGLTFAADNLAFYDKAYGYARASQCGIAVPQTWRRFEEIPSDVETVFVKPSREGSGVKIPVTREKAAIFLTSGYIAQEYIRANGVCGYGFVAHQGKVLVGAPHHEVRSWPRHGGSAAVITHLWDPKFVQLCDNFIREINYTGWGLLEFAWSERLQKYVFFELNAKLWASLEFSFRTTPKLSQILLGVTEREMCREYMAFLPRLADLPAWETIQWLRRRDVTVVAEDGSYVDFVRRWLKRRICRTDEP